MSACIKGGILAGIVLFLWGALSWMVLPWHTTTLHTFKDESAVNQVIISNVPESGIYVLPMPHSAAAKDQAATPFVFASVRMEGMSPSMTMPILTELCSQIIAAIFVGWLLMKTSGLSYMGRVGFVLVFALTAGIVTHGPYWNWFSFDLIYTLVAMSDLLIGWLFAGFVLASWCKR